MRKKVFPLMMFLVKIMQLCIRYANQLSQVKYWNFKIIYLILFRIGTKLKFITKLILFPMYILCGPILPCVPAVWGERPGLISRVRRDEHPRTSSRWMDKITIRGEVEHVCKELGLVRGWWSPRYFCPRCLVNLLITQNNA